jgi:type IV secretory pathway VirB3-like protein
MNKKTQIALAATGFLLVERVLMTREIRRLKSLVTFLEAKDEYNKAAFKRAISYVPIKDFYQLKTDLDFDMIAMINQM